MAFIEQSQFNVIIADTWLKRAGGLLRMPTLSGGEFLWLKPCRSIHTFGMRYAIAVFFLDQHNRVIDFKPTLRPNRLAFNAQAFSVVEGLPFAREQSATVIAQLEFELSSAGG